MQVGPYSCDGFQYGNAYTDAAGKPVRRKVTTTTKVTVEDVPDAAPAK